MADSLNGCFARIYIGKRFVRVSLKQGGISNKIAFFFLEGDSGGRH